MWLSKMWSNSTSLPATETALVTLATAINLLATTRKEPTLMPIKKIHIGFDLDMEVFMRMLAATPADVQFQAFGTDDAKPHRKHRKSPKLLTHSTAPKIPGGARHAILAFLVAHKGEALAFNVISAELIKLEYASGTVSSQLYNLKVDRLARKTKAGWTATAKAVAEVEGSSNGQ